MATKHIHIHITPAVVARTKDAPLRVVKTLEHQKKCAEAGELFKIDNGRYVKVQLSELPLEKPVYSRIGATKDAYRGSWTESMDPEDAAQYKTGAVVNRKGVKAKVESVQQIPAYKTGAGMMIPSKVSVSFSTLDDVV